MDLNFLIQKAQARKLKVGKIYSSYFEVLCPFHDDKNFGNAFIYDKGNFKCFSCGASVPNFLYTNKIYLSEKDLKKSKDIKSNSIPKKIFYKKYPYVNPESFEYCLKRGWNLDFVREFDIRLYKNFYAYIPLKEDHYELRRIKETEENKNLPKAIYSKGLTKDFIFAQEKLDFNKSLFVKEGISGIAKIWVSISKNVTATLGANITNSQMKILNNFKEIILVPDLDEAGRKMILNCLKKLPIQKIRIIIAPDDSEDSFLDFFDKSFSIKELLDINQNLDLQQVLLELMKHYH